MASSSNEPTFKTLSEGLASMNLNPRGTMYVIGGGRIYDVSFPAYSRHSV